MLILIVQVSTTWAMTGVIWFVQLVQYPGFARVDPTSFADFHAFHSNRITLIVAPLMVAEALSAAALLWKPVAGVDAREAWLGLGLVAVIWASTAFLQVPMHARLTAGFDEAAWRFLCQSNWVRTVAWSLRALLVSVWLRRVFGA